MNWHVIIASGVPVAGRIDPDYMLEFFPDRGDLEVVMNRALLWVREYNGKRQPDWPAIRYVEVRPA